MKEYTKDTAEVYDDLIGYIAKDNLPIDLGEFIGETTLYKPNVIPKKYNPDYPEDWQTMYVNFSKFEDYSHFMEILGQAPLPKLKELVFTKQKQTSLEDFFND